MFKERVNNKDNNVKKFNNNINEIDTSSENNNEINTNEINTSSDIKKNENRITKKNNISIRNINHKLKNNDQNPSQQQKNILDHPIEDPIDIKYPFSRFKYRISEDEEAKKLKCYDEQGLEIERFSFSKGNILQQLPKSFVFQKRSNFTPSKDKNFERRFINGLTKKNLIIFCIVIIIIIIITLIWMVFFYYKNELEIMKNRINHETKILLFKKIEEDPFFKINKKKVFLAGAISLLTTATIIYLTIKKSK